MVEREKRDSFMKLEIHEGEVYVVETECGTEIVPAWLCGPVKGEIDCYVNGRKIASFEKKKGYYGRYSASGYMDSTDWSFDTNKRSLEKYLRLLYSDE